MLHFVSEQVYAMRYYADAHPKFGPAGRLGFSWQPTNNPIPPSTGRTCLRAEFLAGQDAIADRIAKRRSSMHTRARTRPPIDACRPPGSGEQWCNSVVPERRRSRPTWLDFAYWK